MDTGVGRKKPVIHKGVFQMHVRAVGVPDEGIVGQVGITSGISAFVLEKRRSKGRLEEPHAAERGMWSGAISTCARPR